MEANRYLACDHKTAFGTGRRQDAGGIHDLNFIRGFKRTAKEIYINITTMTISSLVEKKTVVG